MNRDTRFKPTTLDEEYRLNVEIRGQQPMARRPVLSRQAKSSGLQSLYEL